ncbi:MAG: hypothetical protein HQL47_10910 [Gammaproteobacteria bacterium]|nr:hypothetical protein [Gammaproteobacteria bacterium]
MSGLFEFFSDNLLVIGGVAFIWMLYSMGSRAERVMLLIAAASVLTYALSNHIEAAIGVLIFGGAMMLLDHLRTRA